MASDIIHWQTKTTNRPRHACPSHMVGTSHHDTKDGKSALMKEKLSWVLTRHEFGSTQIRDSQHRYDCPTDWMTLLLAAMVWQAAGPCAVY